VLSFSETRTDLFLCGWDINAMSLFLEEKNCILQIMQGMQNQRIMIRKHILRKYILLLILLLYNY